MGFRRADWPSAKAHFDDLSQNTIRNEGARAKVSISVDRIGPPQVPFFLSILNFSNFSCLSNFYPFGVHEFQGVFGVLGW